MSRTVQRAVILAFRAESLNRTRACQVTSEMNHLSVVSLLRYSERPLEIELLQGHTHTGGMEGHGHEAPCLWMVDEAASGLLRYAEFVRRCAHEQAESAAAGALPCTPRARSSARATPRQCARSSHPNHL